VFEFVLEGSVQTKKNKFRVFVANSDHLLCNAIEAGIETITEV
jgi:hypothetical protein